MSRLPLAALAAVTASLLTACGPDYSGTQFNPRSTAPVPVSLEPNRITLPVGIAVTARVEPQSSNSHPYDEYYQLRLTSQDPNIADVLRGPLEREFVFIGVNEGSTCVDVVMNDEFYECIEIIVEPPAS
ncbi:MAG: hypothetical protein H6713_17075 [Myxococcales bacterium]|nr:hypothetical protein [Myxococcales bacterium]